MDSAPTCIIDPTFSINSPNTTSREFSRTNTCMTDAILQQAADLRDCAPRGGPGALRRRPLAEDAVVPALVERFDIEPFSNFSAK